ncbi:MULTISPECIES: hypothetical protein [Alteribacillus]|uniref:Uncharacterized protein n=1 Tax=Alteribacillus bidgolensis TaxID=930129 RepID=A0A1G8BMS9_9BACI|nr:hypothetical protein [Alteribacillus bidgolensis]SDH33870.1 hypothetical protein SAMN05216352_1014 [Alteribacillus bidgolensis]
MNKWLYLKYFLIVWLVAHGIGAITFGILQFTDPNAHKTPIIAISSICIGLVAFFATDRKINNLKKNNDPVKN